MAQGASAADFNDRSANARGAGDRAAPPPPVPGGAPSEPNEDLGSAERNAVVERVRSRVMLEAFVDAVERLEGVLDQETQMLDQNRPIALHDFNHRKSHGLLELSRAMTACRDLDRVVFDFESKAPLARLRVKLESNLASLQTHLTAVGEIAAVIARAIQDHESDGTYTARRSPGSDRG